MGAAELSTLADTGSLLDLDDVIDPADTRAWIMAACARCRRRTPRTGMKRPGIGTS